MMLPCPAPPGLEESVYIQTVALHFLALLWFKITFFFIDSILADKSLLYAQSPEMKAGSMSSQEAALA